MRGSIRRRGKASWQLRVPLGRDPKTGRDRYSERTVRGSRKDAERVLRELVTELDHARGFDPSGTFGSLVADWWPRKRRELSPNTVSSWDSVLKRYLLPALGERKLYEIRARDLDRLYADLLDQGLSPGRIRTVHAVASVAFDQAVRWDLIAAAPTAHARPPTVPRSEPAPPEPDEVAQLLAVAHEQDPEMWLFLALAANTGARRSEVVGLRWSDIDFAAGSLTISRSIAKGAGGGTRVKGTKTGASSRIAIDDALVEILRAEHRLRRERDAADGYIFTSDSAGEAPWYPDTPSARFRRLRDMAGLEGFNLRDLRHFAATQLLSAGVDVRTVAGRLRHSRPATTLDRYAAFVPARDREAASILGSILNIDRSRIDGEGGATSDS